MENAIEIRNLTKNFGEKQALKGLNMTVPVGSIYGFIGENGSGKSTTEKIICGLSLKSGGSVKLFGKDHLDEQSSGDIGVLIETPGCFMNYSVWNNLSLQASNLGIQNADEEIRRVLKTVRMEGSAGNKYKNCSLGMKQRVGIAMALIGNPKLLVLDEPINGLDADGMRIMREVLVDLAKNHGVTVLISSHILGELEKIATHYGIVRDGKMIREMTAEEFNRSCRTFVQLKASDMVTAKYLLNKRFIRVDEVNDSLRVYDAESPEQVAVYLYENGVTVTELKVDKISLEEYYIDFMETKGGTKMSAFITKLKTMLKVDFKRAFTSPLTYVMIGACFVMPILILVMTTLMDGTVSVNPQTGEETIIEGFKNTFEAIDAISGSSTGMEMSLTSMCNVNMLFFIVAVFACLFICQDFKSGYAKNLFAVRANRTDYVVSKTTVCFFCSALMFIAYLLGTLIGGAISSLPFDLSVAGVDGLVFCMLSKIFLTLIFVSVSVLVCSFAKEKTWLAIVICLGSMMLFYTIVPIVSPLNSGFINALLSLVGGILFATGLGVLSRMILRKTDII